MNSKLMKHIRNKAKGIQLEWVQSLLNEDEAEKINRKNIEDFLPQQTHIWHHRTLYNSAYSYRHIIRTLKSIVKRKQLKDNWKVYDITLKEFQDNIKIHR